MSETYLVVENATKTYPLRRSSLKQTHMVALDGVSLDVSESQIVGLVGESGCGKSTLGRCILHLTQLDDGAIKLRGEDIHRRPERQFRPLRRELQMVFQNPKTSFNPAMTISESLVDSMRLRRDLGRSDKQALALDLLASVQLRPRFATHYPSQVSGGELQRAALARALAVAPRFVFLDEPTSALDMSIRGQIVNLLLDIQERNRMSYIFVSHDLSLVRYVAHRIYVMYRGQVVEAGTREGVFDAPLHPYTRALLAATLVGREARRETRRHTLRGEVMMQSYGSGCRLYPRCAEATDRCSKESQHLATIHPGRQVRCWRVSEGC